MPGHATIVLKSVAFHVFLFCSSRFSSRRDSRGHFAREIRIFLKQFLSFLSLDRSGKGTNRSHPLKRWSSKSPTTRHPPVCAPSSRNPPDRCDFAAGKSRHFCASICKPFSFRIFSPRGCLFIDSPLFHPCPFHFVSAHPPPSRSTATTCTRRKAGGNSSGQSTRTVRPTRPA